MTNFEKISHPLNILTIDKKFVFKYIKFGIKYYVSNRP